MEVDLGMFFLILSNADVIFAKQELISRLYTPVEALSKTNWVQIIGQKEFARIALDPDKAAFVMHLAYLGSNMSIHPSCENWITLLVAKQVIILAKCIEFADVVLKKSDVELPKQTKINQSAIDL